MLGNFKFDEMVEKMSRRVAGRTSRRGAIGRLGTVLAGVKPGEECYFIHSYEAKPAEDTDRLADTVYGGRNVCAAAAHGAVVGCQFHPEKSGEVGLRIIEQYLALI